MRPQLPSLGRPQARIGFSSRGRSSSTSRSTGRRSAEVRRGPTRGRALRRHQRRAQLLPRDGDRGLRRARRRLDISAGSSPTSEIRPQIGFTASRACSAQHGARVARRASSRAADGTRRELDRTSSTRARTSLAIISGLVVSSSAPMSRLRGRQGGALRGHAARVVGGRAAPRSPAPSLAAPCDRLRPSAGLDRGSAIGGSDRAGAASVRTAAEPSDGVWGLRGDARTHAARSPRGRLSTSGVHR